MSLSLSLLLLLLVLTTLHEAFAVKGHRYLTSNVTETLDSLLAVDRYDKRLRPGFGGPPITISVNLDIRSMGPVSENDQSFGLDCYFRQNWYDLRLRYQKLPGLEEFSMSWLFLDKVWKPDTYFVNGKKSYLHRITVPNKFLRLRYDGYITYSMRLTVMASCPMYLRKFPLDAQRCPLVLGSYGYTNKDLLYRWSEDRPVVLKPGVELAQFDLVNVTTEEEKTLTRGTQSYSTVQADFWLKRHTGFFMLQVYIPMGIIVTCSWISFWIDPDAVPARVTLGVTTVLSLTTMGFGGRAQLPKVSYWTALDWFVIICFTSVFSVMIEYAIVNFIDKFTKDLKKILQTRKDADKAEKTKEKQVGKTDTKNLLSLDDDATPGRTRSASLSLASPAEKPCRRISIPCNLRRPSVGANLETKFTLPDLDASIQAIKQLPRRLSATVKEFINIGQLQEKLSRSIRDLTTEEDERALKPETWRTVPKLVVSSLENEDLIDFETEIVETEVEPADMVVDVESDAREEDDSENIEKIQKKKIDLVELFKKIRSPRELWESVKILPQEMDVLRLLEDPDPPDKFSKIDIQSRRSFPIVFLIALTVYLFAFSYYLTDDFPERDTDIILHKH